MRKYLSNYNLEKGQVLPLVVLMMFVIIGMVALILDGSAIMSDRRTAQAAADAGALAGAQRICAGKTDAAVVAQDYATLQNEATSALVTVAGQEVTVAATVQRSSFFARIFGEDNLTATADATAGCFFPSNSKRMLPIAFYYETPPINAKSADCSNPLQPCSLINWPFIELMDLLRATTDPTNLPLDDIYVVSEKTKVCEKPLTGPIVCTDMKDNASGGNRTWIDLNEVNTSNLNLKKVITDGVDQTMELPAWLNGQTGVVSAVYDGGIFGDLELIKDYEDVAARLVVVPVFDRYCASDPENTIGCGETGDHYYLVNTNQQSYRLVGLAPFVVTCVTKSDKCEFGDCVPKNTGMNTTNKDMCPGYLATNPDKTGNAIEGYFVEDVPVDTFTWGTGGVDVGLYLISLSD